MLTNIEAVIAMVEAGKKLVLAGEEPLLRRVPKGQWIGGTIPYFMSDTGGVTTRDQIYVDEIPSIANAAHVRVYDTTSISTIASETPDDGYSVLIIPAFSALHQQYALEARLYEHMFLRVVAGWIAGVHLDDLGRATPLVFDGTTGAAFGDRGVAMQIQLPTTQQADLQVINIFEPGPGDVIEFVDTGFAAKTCRVNGKQQNIVEYIKAHALDTRLPLVANYMGTYVNVSVQSLDGDTAKFYAPVFTGVQYRWAKAIGGYPEHFAAAIPTNLAKPAFSCNCVLNYLYGNLQDRRTGSITGPMTFGEIGYQLLNQTLVYVSIVPR